VYKGWKVSKLIRKEDAFKTDITYWSGEFYPHNKYDEITTHQYLLKRHLYFANISCVFCHEEFYVYYNLLNLDFKKEITNHFYKHFEEYLLDNPELYKMDTVFRNKKQSNLSKITAIKSDNEIYTIYMDGREYIISQNNLINQYNKFVDFNTLKEYTYKKILARKLMSCGSKEIGMSKREAILMQLEFFTHAVPSYFK
jgi:hypothetical protein